MVWVGGRHCRTERPSRNLENKYHGPYRVSCLVGIHTYELDIPDTVRKHRVFPVSKLHLTADDPLPGQILPTPLPVVIDGEEKWEVEEILDSR